MKYLLPFLFLATACSSASKSPLVASQTEYDTIVKENTRSANKYSGLYQTFQASSTLLNTEMQTAALKLRGEYSGWDAPTAQKERDRVFQEMSNSTKIFLRFYSPESENDDLHKPTTIWKAYLEHEGRRILGKVKKLTLKFVELQMLYPHMDRFSSPYEITFPVPTTAVEGSEVIVHLTSSLGATEFTFPPRK